MRQKKERISLFMRSYTLIVFIVLIVILISFFFYIISSTYSTVYKQAKDTAINYTVLENSEVDNQVARAYVNLQKLQSGVKGAGDVSAVLTELSQSMDFSYIRYFTEDKEIDIAGTDVFFESGDEIQALMNAGEIGSTGLIYDYNTRTKGLAFYAPVSDNPALTGIVAFLECNDLLGVVKTDQTQKTEENEAGNTDTADSEQKDTPLEVTEESEDLPEDVSSKPSFHSVASMSGRIIYQESIASFPTDKSTNVFDYIRNLTASKSLLDEMKKTLAAGGNGSEIITVKTDKYVIAYCGMGISDSLFSISIFPAEQLVREGRMLINQLTVTTVCICILFFLVLLYLFFFQGKYRRRVSEGVVVDPMLGCSTFQKFCADASELIKSNTNSKFVVIYLEIHKFKNISASFGAELSDNVIRYLNKIISKILTGKETYGHITDDRFIMIFHYYNVMEMMDRLKVINALLYNYEDLKRSGYTVKLSCGAYCSERKNTVSIEEMVDCASIAQKNNESNAVEICTIYDERVRAKYLQEAEIESKMEQSLEDGCFLPYFQPKYNIASDRLDSAECLVRWYDKDKGEMISPGVFINLFESDGFIKKLDRYMFTAVCKFIAGCVRSGDHIVPISVNVSRVTALEPDFAEFYITEKKKYRIADNFIVLEFTESFASENDTAMLRLVTKLKNNGFRCSIDDFGSGYSSYSVLKEMPMDELKLDKFFIKKGVSGERDDTLLDSMINLAKKMKMRVVQEGVEVIEELDRLRHFGCDVVQGFYYSRPLTEEDFITFINSDTSLDAVRARMKKQ